MKQVLCRLVVLGTILTAVSTGLAQQNEISREYQWFLSVDVWNTDVAEMVLDIRMHLDLAAAVANRETRITGATLPIDIWQRASRLLEQSYTLRGAGAEHRTAANARWAASRDWVDNMHLRRLYAAATAMESGLDIIASISSRRMTYGELMLRAELFALRQDNMFLHDQLYELTGR